MVPLSSYTGVRLEGSQFHWLSVFLYMGDGELFRVFSGPSCTVFSALSVLLSKVTRNCSELSVVILPYCTGVR